jgi:hypothetical protein
MTKTKNPYKWVTHEGKRYFDIGWGDEDGLYNPNGYPEWEVAEALFAADERRSQRRSEAAKRAAETRRIRQEKRVYEAARRIVDGHVFGPRQHCYICGKGLTDPESIERGIGSDCWQVVLTIIERGRRGAS